MVLVFTVNWTAKKFYWAILTSFLAAIVSAHASNLTFKPQRKEGAGVETRTRSNQVKPC